MAAAPTNGNATTNADTTNLSAPIIQFNPASQLPLKLTGSINFSTWKAQVSMLMYGHDLFGHLDGTVPPPPRTIGTTTTPNPAYTLWFRQDKLIQNALMASVDHTIAPIIANASTSHAAWQSLHATYANKSQSRLFSLRDQLARLTKDTQSMTEYLTRIRALADELAQAGSPITNDELVVHILRGLGPEYREISAAIRARDTTITFEDLFDKLLDHDVFLLHAESKKPTAPITAAYAANDRSRPRSSPRPARRYEPNGRPHDRADQQHRPWRANGPAPSRSQPPNTHSVKCQLCRRFGHEANVCRSRSHNHFEAKAHYAATTPSPSSPWILDTGATHHITSDSCDMPDYLGTEGISMGNGMTIPITHSGSTQINASNSSFCLSNALCAPQIKKNLISVSQFCKDNKTSIEFFPTFFCVKDLRTKEMLVRGRSNEGLYEWPNPYPLANLATKSTPLEVWHHRLGHPHSKTFNLVCRNLSLPFREKDSFTTCNSCLCNKSHRLPFHEFTLSSTKPLQTVFSDLWGPSPVLSIDKKLYYCIFVDHFTKYTWIFTLKNKTEVKPIFQHLMPVLEKHFDQKILSLYTDGGTEYKSLDPFLLANGVEHLVGPPYTPQRIATAERRHRHIVETAKTLMSASSLPTAFWSFACHHAVYLINRMPTPILNNLSPYEKLFHKSPDYASLRSFGCLCYPWLRPYTNNKLDPRSVPCVYLGFSLTHHCHQCYDPIKSKLYLSRDVVFVESEFPYNTRFKSLCSATSTLTWEMPIDQIPSSPLPYPPQAPLLPEPLPASTSCTRQQLGTHAASPASNQPNGTLLPSSLIHSNNPILHPALPLTTSPSLSSSLDNPQTSPMPNDNATPAHMLPDPMCQPTQPLVQSTEPTLPSTEIPITQSNPPPHRPITRSQNNIFKPKQKQSYLIESAPTTVPTTIKQAKQHKVWRDAMQLEFDALMSNRTWDLVPHDPSKNVVACRWLFRIKRKSDGSIDRYKARLVAKGFTQRPGIDYHSTFSPVVKPTTVRIVLSLAVAQDWVLRQLDVNNAFLQGTLAEEVYMAQPPGYESTTNPTHVCRLRKAIYGLKQAPLAWYTALQTHLVSIGFVKSDSDPSLFIRLSAGLRIFVLVYVDDIIVTGSHVDVVNQVIHSLAHRFSIKDLGTLNFFLGVEVLHSKLGLLLSQSNYIEELLSSEGMHESKPASTPMSTSTVLTLNDGANRFDATRYRTVLGKLQYLSFTRPDICYSVNKLSQFMHQPSEIHWTALKRILRYLRGTSTLSLLLKKSNDLTLSMYSDADWAGDIDGRNSTSGHILFFGKNPVSWSSKKQQTVARSSTEAEFKAVANSASEVCWVQNLLKELTYCPTIPPTIYCDNVGVLYLSRNPVINTRMKHVAVDFHYVRNMVHDGKLQVRHVNAKNQLADTLTKPLSKSVFHSNLIKLGVASNYKLEGGVLG